MASLLVVTGPPGAGKSTVSRLLAHRVSPSVLVEGDAFFGFLARGAIPPWDPASAVQNDVVTRAAAAATGRFVLGGFATVYDGVLGAWFVPTFLAASGLETLDYAVLLPPLERCLAGVRDRVGHEFNDEGATRHMHDQFTAATVAPRHVLTDLPDRPGAVADLVAGLQAAGELTYGA